VGNPGPGTLARGLSTRSGDTMNALAAKDIEAADLLARLDGDSSPGRCGPPWSHPGRPVPDVIATTQEPNDPRPPPETSGGHSAVARSPGRPRR